MSKRTAILLGFVGVGLVALVGSAVVDHFHGEECTECGEDCCCGEACEACELADPTAI